jgi:hypothetical protein
MLYIVFGGDGSFVGCYCLSRAFALTAWHTGHLTELEQHLQHLESSLNV